MTNEDVIEILYDIVDPEIKINIYDLGMIYGIAVDDRTITLDITLTSAGCPLADILEKDISEAFLSSERDVQLNWVWLPAWDINRITPEGREQLTAIGYPMVMLKKSTWVKRTKEDFND